jgi:hypothetical protein
MVGTGIEMPFGGVVAQVPANADAEARSRNIPAVLHARVENNNCSRDGVSTNADMDYLAISEYECVQGLRALRRFTQPAEASAPASRRTALPINPCLPHRLPCRTDPQHHTRDCPCCRTFSRAWASREPQF